MMTKRELIKDGMERKGYNKRQVADEIEVSLQTIYNVLKGVSSSENTLIKLLNCLDIDLNDYINAED